MKKLGKILFSLMVGLTLATQANAQTDKQQLITTIEIDLNIKDLMKEVTSLYVTCNLYNDLKLSMNASGYAVLLEDDTFPGGRIDTEKYPSINFIVVKGFPKSGVKQSISVNVFGVASSLAWITGSCKLLISDENYSTATDWMKTIKRGIHPNSCEGSYEGAADLYACNSPYTDMKFIKFEFDRPDRYPDRKKK